MIRPIASTLLACTLLTACASSQVATVETDIQAVASDAATVLATGVIPQPADGIASLVLAGIRTVDSEVMAAAGQSDETVAIAGLRASVQQLLADSTDATVQTSGNEALIALSALSATSGASATVQAEAATGAVLIDYLAVKREAPAVSAERGGAIGVTPDTQGMQAAAALADARAHLKKLGHGAGGTVAVYNRGHGGVRVAIYHHPWEVAGR